MKDNRRRDAVRAELEKDFLSRDKGFIHQRKTDRTGWEKELKSRDGSLSGAFTDTSSQEAVLRGATKAAESMVAAMGVPGGVEIHVDDSQSYTDCKHLIVLATDCFDDTALTPGQALDCFTGEAVHEAAHILYTSPTGSAAYGAFVRDMENIIEDERIERRVGDDLPGFANYLRATKYRYFDQSKCAGAMSSVPEEQFAARILNAVIKLVRYPDAFDDRDIDDFGEELLQVKRILTPYPESTQEALQRSLAIRDLFRKWLKEEAQRRQQQQQQDGQGGQQGDNSPEEGNDGGNGRSDGKQNGERQQGSGGTEDGTRQASGKKGPSDASGGSQAPRMTDAQADAVLDKAAKAILGEAAGHSDPDEKHKCRAVRDADGTADALIRGAVEKAGAPGNEKFSVVFPEKLNPSGKDFAKTRYHQSAARIKHLVPAMKKILALSGTEYTHRVTGRLCGRLDAGKLAEAVQGVPSVYSRTISAKTSKTAVCVLIDESGSMYGRKITAALDAAVLLAESVGKLPNVDFFCYGFTTGIINVYAEHGHRASETLGYLRDEAGTPTGRAIREAVHRVRRQTEEACLLFVVTDGDPDCRENVPAAVKDAIGKGFSPVGIGIDGMTTGQFPESADVEDISRLPVELGKIVRGGLLKRSKRTFSERA